MSYAFIPIENVRVALLVTYNLLIILLFVYEHVPCIVMYMKYIHII